MESVKCHSVSKDFNVTIRNVELGDSEAVFAIRNMPSVYKYFRNPRIVTKEKHSRWFATQLQPANQRNFFIAIFDGEILGYLRYDWLDEVYDISIAVVPEFQQQGIGSILLRQTLPQIAREKKKIQAEVEQENIASQKFFEKHGFTKSGEKGNSVIFIWTSSEE